MTNAYASYKAHEIAVQLKNGVIFDKEWIFDYFSKQCKVSRKEFETLVEVELRDE